MRSRPSHCRKPHQALTTGKYKKVDSLHVPVRIFTGQKHLIYRFLDNLLNYVCLKKKYFYYLILQVCEIWGHFVKKNKKKILKKNYLIVVQISEILL